MKVLYLCGAGNSEGIRLALRVNEKGSRWDKILLLDDDPAKHGQSILGVRIEGPFALLEHVDRGSTEVANLVARTTVKRWAAHCRIKEFGLRFAPLIHPTVDVMGAELNDNVVIYQNAVIGPEVTIGEGSVVFMGAIVGHESHMGQCCVLAPNAVINARVQLGDGAYIGSNAAVLPEIKIGPWATLGVGSVATQDVPAHATVVGVPGRVLISPGEKVKMPGAGPHPDVAVKGTPG